MASLNSISSTSAAPYPRVRIEADLRLEPMTQFLNGTLVRRVEAIWWWRVLWLAGPDRAWEMDRPFADYEMAKRRALSVRDEMLNRAIENKARAVNA